MGTVGYCETGIEVGRVGYCEMGEEVGTVGYCELGEEVGRVGEWEEAGELPGSESCPLSSCCSLIFLIV